MVVYWLVLVSHKESVTSVLKLSTGSHFTSNSTLFVRKPVIKLAVLDFDNKCRQETNNISKLSANCQQMFAFVFLGFGQNRNTGSR
jgi:hypothetical protein